MHTTPFTLNVIDRDSQYFFQIFPKDMTSGASRSMFSAAIGNDEEIIVCDVTETNALVDGRCEGFISLMLTVYSKLN